MPTIKPDPLSETVPAAEANRRFSELLRGVKEEGRTFTITSHGRPVAQVTRPTMSPLNKAQAERAVAWEALKAHLRTTDGLKIEPWTRDELYDHDPKG